ncbi:Ribonuclease H1 [Coemansia sp. RSA 486]|nr:Ribonuclease H1 [Coemansia sp. RSA 486]
MAEAAKGDSWEFVYMRNVDMGRVTEPMLSEIWQVLGVDQYKVACASSIGGFLAEFVVRKDYVGEFVRILSAITTPEPLDSSLSINRDNDYIPASPYVSMVSMLQDMPRKAQDALNKYSRDALARRWSSMYHSSADRADVQVFLKASLERNSLQLLPPQQPSEPLSSLCSTQGSQSRRIRAQKDDRAEGPRQLASSMVHYRTPNNATLSHDHLAELVPEPSATQFVAYADGAYLPEKGAAGIGIYFVNPRLTPMCERLAGHQSNARAEIFAMVYALNQLTNVLPAISRSSNGSSLPEVWICSDSRYAVNGVNVYMETWEQSGWLTSKGRPIANRKAFQLLRSAIYRLSNNGYNVLIHHLPAHAGIQGNEVADMLAKAGALL